MKNVERGPGVFDWRHYPGPPMRSAWERQCAGPLCLPARALSSVSGGSRWGGCGSRRTGSTTVSVVRCRCVSVNAAITATCIAPASVRGSVAASRVRRAQARYQRSRRGARRHAARQRRWRTDNGRRKNSDASGIPGHGDPVHRGGQSRHPEPTHRCESLRARPNPKIRPSRRCAFCGARYPRGPVSDPGAGADERDGGESRLHS